MAQNDLNCNTFELTTVIATLNLPNTDKYTCTLKLGNLICQLTCSYHPIRKPKIYKEK